MDAANIEEDAATLELGEDFTDSKPNCMWNSEVRIILEHHLSLQAEDPSMSQDVLMQTLKYVRKFNNYSDFTAIKAAKEMIDASGFELADFEVAAINNLQIDTADEAYSLIPSLKEKFPNEDDLNNLLDNLKRYQSA